VTAPANPLVHDATAARGDRSRARQDGVAILEHANPLRLCDVGSIDLQIERKLLHGTEPLLCSNDPSDTKPAESVRFGQTPGGHESWRETMGGQSLRHEIEIDLIEEDDEVARFRERGEIGEKARGELDSGRIV